MDGNGRWAAARGKSRISGHQAGVDAVRKIVHHAAKRGTRYLTLFSFSTENWKRPKDEVQALFALLKKFVEKDLSRLHDEGVRVCVLGNRTNLPVETQKLLSNVEEKTRSNTGLNLNIAFNYGGRDEIRRMVQSIGQKILSEEIKPDQVTEEMICKSLDTAGHPDPDMIIRTSGENRISNFLLWQSAYSEFILLDVLWPDFGEREYDQALKLFSKRNRRIGGVDSK
ncbi:MAG: di-trans,poly-cis-decaprenylcistransferase [Robiginitomaculum sp.]|nr:MAG: di-trans,poly-cis-decaprenylcistransferase [Robiginitomaculum sp.]